MSTDIYSSIIELERERAKRLARIHEGFTPHLGQLMIGKPIFSQGANRVFGQCGRDLGKSMGGGYFAARFAATFPKTYTTVIFPERAQGQKISWDSGYIKDRVHQEFFVDGDPEKTFNKSELLITLDNKSRIQILGSDNPDSLRGLKPDFCIFDEFRDFKSDVYNIMEANLLGKILLILTTPADVEGFYTELLQMFQDEIKANNKKYRLIQLPTETNPLYAEGGPRRDELMSVKKRLIKSGQLAFWRREYEAVFIPGGAGSVFKKYQSNKKNIERNSDFLKNLIAPDKHVLRYFCIADPSQNGCFAVIWAAINPRSGQIYIFRAHGERDNENTGAPEMWKVMKRGMLEIYPYPERWVSVYDEAAAWFFNDLNRHKLIKEEDTLEPTQKRLGDKNEEMSLLKDMFSDRGRIFISRDQCQELISEVQNYNTDKKGKYHKNQGDDFIDCLRYLLQASEFEPLEDDSQVSEDDPLYETASQRIKNKEGEERALTGDMDYYDEYDRTGEYNEAEANEDPFEFPYLDETAF